MKCVCKSSVTTGERKYSAGEVIDLPQASADQLLAAGVVEPAPVEVEAVAPKIEKPATKPSK